MVVNPSFIQLNRGQGVTTVAFDILMVVGFMLVFSSAPLVGVGCLLGAFIVRVWLYPSANENNEE